MKKMLTLDDGKQNISVGIGLEEAVKGGGNNRRSAVNKQINFTGSNYHRTAAFAVCAEKRGIQTGGYANGYNGNPNGSGAYFFTVVSYTRTGGNSAVAKLYGGAEP